MSDSVESGVKTYGQLRHPRTFGNVQCRLGADGPINAVRTKPVRIVLIALLCLVGSFALFACGSIVSSRESLPQYSETKPIQVGDVIFYYLPTGVIKVDGTYDKDKGWTVTVTPDIHADANHRYELSLNQRYPFFDHTAILTADDKGLLKTVNATSTDRTVDAIGALITAAGQVMQFGASLAGRAHDAEASPPFHITLDPFNRNKRSATAAGFTISVNAPPEMERASTQDEASVHEGRYPGIMTRLTMPFTVTVAPTGDDAVKTTVLIPDRRQRYLLTVPRGLLVTTETTVDFVNGSMVSRNMKRPSVAYGILGIPKTILSALVPIPGTVQTAANTRIQNQITLLKETAELQKLQNPSPTATPATSPAGTSP